MGAKLLTSDGVLDARVARFLNLDSWRSMERECTLAIKALAQQRRLPAALEVLDAMPARGAQPNVFHYTAAVAAMLSGLRGELQGFYGALSSGKGCWRLFEMF